VRERCQEGPLVGDGGRSGLCCRVSGADVQGKVSCRESEGRDRANTDQEPRISSHAASILCSRMYHPTVRRCQRVNDSTHRLPL
jgi:hypothetical protein